MQALFGIGFLSTSSKALGTRLELGMGAREHYISLIVVVERARTLRENACLQVYFFLLFSSSSTLTFPLMSTRKITLICLICSVQSSSVSKIKDGDYKTLHSRLKQIVDVKQHLNGLTRLTKKTIVVRRPISA